MARLRYRPIYAEIVDQQESCAAPRPRLAIRLDTIAALFDPHQDFRSEGRRLARARSICSGEDLALQAARALLRASVRDRRTLVRRRRRRQPGVVERRRAGNGVRISRAAVSLSSFFELGY